jgi:hypothetical protein
MTKRSRARSPMVEILEAIEHGTVPAGTAIRAALRGERHLARWVAASRQRWERSAERRATVRGTPAYPPDLVAAALAAARRRDGDKEGVVSVHWGLARREGRSTAEPAVIVVVRRKVAKPARTDRVKPTLTVRHRGKSRTIRVDVQAISTAGALHGARPGDHAAADVEGFAGAVGAVTERDGELYVVLAGHVARRVGLAPTARAPSGATISLGRVDRVHMDDRDDVASCGPITRSDADRIALPEVEVRDLGTDDLNTAIWIQTARDFSPRKAFLTDLDVTVPFEYEDGTRNVSGLLGTSHQVTEPGDSGAPVTDFQDRLVGFVIGAYDGRTYLIPARRALDDLAA